MKKKRENEIEIQEMYNKGLNKIRHTPLLKKKKKKLGTLPTQRTVIAIAHNSAIVYIF